MDTGGPQHDVHPPDCAQFAGDAFISSHTFFFKQILLLLLFVVLPPLVCALAEGSELLTCQTSLKCCAD